MEVMEALYIAFGFFLLMAGVQDSKSRKVSDKLSACMWVLGAGLCLFNNSLYPNLVGVFALLYIYNSFAYPINPKFGFGWADILIIPVYATFLSSIGGNLALMVGIGTASMLTLGYLLMFKKGAPYVLFLAVSYVVVLMVGYVVVPGAW
jgi:hypothetical protein